MTYFLAKITSTLLQQPDGIRHRNFEREYLVSAPAICYKSERAGVYYERRPIEQEATSEML